MKMSDDVVEFIAERLKNNVRQIEGVVRKIYAVYQMNNRQPTIGDANDAIKDVIYYAQPTEVTINNIIQQVGKAFGISPSVFSLGSTNAIEISNGADAGV